MRNENNLKEIFLKSDYDVAKTFNDEIMSEELKQITILMNYDRSKTLLEQPDSVMDRRLGISSNNAKDLGMTQKEYEYQVFTKPLESVIEFFSDPHVLLPLGAVILTISTGGIGGLVLAGVLELADVALYYYEGDKKSAGIALAFAFIPGAQLAKRLGLPFLENMSKSAVNQLIKKVDDGVKLKSSEAKIIEGIDKNKKWILRQYSINATKTSLKSLFSKYTGIKLLILLQRLARIGLISWRTTYNLSKYGLGILTLWQIGTILGEYMGGESPDKENYPEQYKVLSTEKKEIFKESLKNAIEDKEIFKPIIEEANRILETNDEDKNIQIAKVISTMNDEIDSILLNNSSN